MPGPPTLSLDPVKVSATDPTLGQGTVDTKGKPTKYTPPKGSATDPVIQQAAQTTASGTTPAATSSSGNPIESAAEQGLTGQLQQINPLAMQLFTQHILMPWMKQLQQQTTAGNQQYQTAEQQIAGLPYMKGNVAAQDQLAQVPLENLGSTNLVNAYLGAAVAAPEQALQAQAMQQIQSLLGQDIAQRQKLAAYYDPSYQILAGQAQSGALGGTTGTNPLGIGAATSLGLPAPPTAPVTTPTPATTTP